MLPYDGTPPGEASGGVERDSHTSFRRPPAHGASSPCHHAVLVRPAGAQRMTEKMRRKPYVSSR